MADSKTLKIEEILKRFPEKRIVVLGDVFLDHFIYGNISRMSPEAPVPVVNFERETYSPGGAANTAVNIAALGGNAGVFGLIGIDSYAERLIDLLDKRKIGTGLQNALHETTLKTRIMVDNGNGNYQHFCRLDKERHIKINKTDKKEITTRLYKDLESFNPDIIAISDYAKGFLDRNLVGEIKKYAEEKNKKILVDTKPKNLEFYKGVYLIKPNAKEAREMTGIDDIEKAGIELQKRTGANIIITKGKDGMSIFEKDKFQTMPTYAKEIYDVSGAGDTVLASLAMAIASGADLEQAARIANHAAGITVGKRGITSVSLDELERSFLFKNRKIKSLDELVEITRKLKDNGKKIVWTNGCFDILHQGHIEYLREARKLGDILYVGLNSDESVRRLKGPTRPVNNEQERAEVIAALEFVDYVTIFNELSPLGRIKMLKPDIYAKGGDYTLDTINQEERYVVESYDGKIKFLPVVEGKSTTKTIEKIEKIKDTKQNS